MQEKGVDGVQTMNYNDIPQKENCSVEFWPKICVLLSCLAAMKDVLNAKN